MARTVRSAQLQSRSARLRLKPRSRPYKAPSAKAGLHLGYRRFVERNGSWVAFTYQGSSGRYVERAFAQADDYSEADGSEVLDYYAAMQRVSGEAPPVQHGARHTVSDAVSDYIGWLARHRKTASDAKSRLEAYVIPYMAGRSLTSLKRSDLNAWLEWALAHKPRGRLKDGKQAGKSKREIAPAERLRRRKSTLNRVMNYLLAALNRAHEQGWVQSRDAWGRLRKFHGAESACVARLSADEARRLVNACPPDFRQLVEAALLTGCRYGELAALRARDYESRMVTMSSAQGAPPRVEQHGSILVAESKSGKPRRVPVTAEGVRFFESLAAGKLPDDLLLMKADGSSWAKSEQFRRIRAACDAARISPAVNFHALRHTTASLLVERGAPLAFVAEILGHSDIRMVSKHYAHLAPSVIAESIRANLQSFDVRIDERVAKIRSPKT